MAQVGIIPWMPPRPHDHSSITQGGQISFVDALTNKPFVDVRDYGASPASSGAVNSQAFIDAFAVGNHVKIPLEGTLELASAVLPPPNSSLMGLGKLVTVLQPAGGVDAIHLDNSAGGYKSYVHIEDLGLNHGRRGISITGGGNLLKANFKRLRCYAQTDSGIYMNGVNFLTSSFEDIEALTNDYGVRFIASVASNVISWNDCRFANSRVCGTFLDALSATYNISGHIMQNCVWENNEKIGLEIDGGRWISLVGGHFENNGTEADGAPHPSVVLKGKVAFPTQNINFDNVLLGAGGANQANLALQVQSNNVNGIIRLKDCFIAGGAEIVDLGAFAVHPELRIHGDLPGGGVTGNINNYENDSGLSPPTELTIAGGVITVTKGYHTVDTQGDAGADNLDTINGGVDGMILVLRCDTTGRQTTVTEAGNIKLTGVNCLLANTAYCITLLYDVTLAKWIELSRGMND